MNPVTDHSPGANPAPKRASNRARDDAAPAFERDSRLPASRDLIAGRRCVPGVVLGGALDDPNTGLPLASRLATRPEDVERALAAAHAVHVEGSWAAAGVEGRSVLLLRLADELTVRAESMALAESLNTGIVLGVTTAMTGGCADQVRALVDQLHAAGTVTDLPGRGRGGPVRLRRDPWGPAVALAPWNAPAPTAVGKSAAALAAGCPVILKPSEWAPGSSDLLAEALVAAEVPPGVFQLVHGDRRTGAQLAGDPRVRAVAMTGGVAGGREVAWSAAANFTRLQLELGGNNPVIVRSDADLAATAAALATGLTKLNGQWCEAPGRVFVPTVRHDALVEALLAELARLTIGSSLAPSTQLGPLSHWRHLARLGEQVDAAVARGAQALTPPVEVPDQGWFMAPTVIVGLDPREAVEEIFGPVVTVHPVASDDEAVAAANATPDGLAGYVFGRDIEAAFEVGSRLRGGEIKINGTSLLDLTDASHQSFWGTSGYGGHGAGEALEFFRGNRIVGVDNPDVPI